MQTLTRWFRFFRSLPLWYQIGGVALVALVGVGVRVYFFHATPTTSNDTSISHVQVASVQDLASQSAPLPLSGTVTSVNQATILAQTAGEIVRLNVSIGDHVAAGESIGQFENSSQQAAVVQAQGSFAAAQAALAKAEGTTAQNSGITSTQAATAAQNAKDSLAATLQSAYASLDDAIHNKSDPFFSNPRGNTPLLQPFTIPDSALVVRLQNERAVLEGVLSKASAAVNSTDDISTRTQTILDAAATERTFLNDLISAMNQAVPNSYASSATIATDNATLAAARTEVVGAVSSVTTAKAAYDSAQTGAQTASNSATQGTQSDIAAAQASLQSAQGTLDAARAALAKTIIRSPISGTIVSLPISQGDYVSSFAQVATVSNPSALYIDAQLTPTDASSITIGSKAMISGDIPGTVTFIAPAIDPSTGKIEAKVAIQGNQSALSAGEVVSLSIDRVQTTTKSKGLPTITIPINAVKVVPSGPEVFTVSASSTLVATPISLGTLLGDRVTVASGLSNSMEIVTDARGLSEGQSVIVDSATTTSP